MTYLIVILNFAIIATISMAIYRFGQAVKAVIQAEYANAVIEFISMAGYLVISLLLYNLGRGLF